jgi:hypothetical protein
MGRRSNMSGKMALGDEFEERLRCTVCGEVVAVCSICRTGFRPDHVIRCHREAGHDHGPCATAKMRKLSDAPPSSGKRPR